MSMEELSESYRESATLCRVRAAELRERLRTELMGETERMLLRRRINLLVEMAAETASTARYLRDYYGRRTWKR
ncbi:MAG: hypothetical protein LUC21_03165 [Oscillospiraceae bacterium]|nr:hypothetical protein [Oscillospiraceae bacterium]MCD7767631.1 hypothetical protein [Oscillospiraceae bacterium]MCD7933933.1 hypothetical protein [Oscillospiraceae bacterium]MCD8001674.1 hypothetical protein [Oscillospiraceae bacterium]MCD8357967.1 hypothetical protein [Oscillospiraceae bacterium]